MQMENFDHRIVRKEGFESEDRLKYLTLLFRWLTIINAPKSRAQNLGAGHVATVIREGEDNHCY